MKLYKKYLTQNYFLNNYNNLIDINFSNYVRKEKELWMYILQILLYNYRCLYYLLLWMESI